MKARIARGFDEHQLRAPDGKWSDGAFNTDGLDYVFDTDGTFGSAMLGLDPVGDVRFGFHDTRGRVRELDLGLNEVEGLRDAIEELADGRDDLPDDGIAADVYDDRNWGASSENRAELLGSGVIAVTFGYGEDDAWVLHLDPPYSADPNDPDDEDIDDVQALLDAFDELWDAADVEGFLEDDEAVAGRARSPENGDNAPPAGGQFAPGGGRIGAKGGKPKSRRRPKAPAPTTGPLTFDGKTGSGYGIKGGDPRVRTLQAALTRLGVTDAAGKELAPDGKYGPKTTSAVKKLQKALGLEQDGKVTPELLKQITETKQLPPAKPKAPRKRQPTTRRSLLSIVNRALRLGVEVRHQQLFDRAFALDDIQILRSGDGRTVEAYAAMFDQPYEVRDQHGHYMEVIDRAAFNRTLSNGAGKQAMCLYNHGMSVVDGKPDSLAQVPIGTPLEIKADGRGLLTVTRYNRSPLADSVLEAIRAGSIRSQSFRGRIVRSSPDRVPLRSRSGGLPTITRHELGLSDYGPTPIPVNMAAEIVAVRSKQELLSDFAALDDDDRLELLRSLGVDLDGGHLEELQDEAPTLGDDTPTSDHSELGAEDPVAARSAVGHSSRQFDLAQRIKAGRTARGMK